MKSKDAPQTLRISRPTLTKYVKEGRIRATLLENGRYDYNEDDVYAVLLKGVPRKTVIYGRVSTNKQKADLENQLTLLKTFCMSNGYQIHNVYSDVASGIDFEKRKEFFVLLDEVLNKRVQRVVIAYKDRLSRVGFDMFKWLFEHYGCEIVVVSEVGNDKLDSEEIFEEIVSLLHCYSMKLYSKRKRPLIKEITKDEK